jgi:hypothetical protein
MNSNNFNWTLILFVARLMFLSAYNFFIFYLIKFGDFQLAGLKRGQFKIVHFFNNLQRVYNKISLKYYLNRLQIFENKKKFVTTCNFFFLIFFSALPAENIENSTNNLARDITHCVATISIFVL